MKRDSILKRIPKASREAELKKYKHLANHYKELYLSTNHLYEHFKTQFAPGHFYSPYPDLKDLEARERVVFDRSKRDIAGIDLREKQQLALLRQFKKYYKDFPYKDSKKKLAGQRYQLGMHAYSYTDAIFLYSFMRHFKPKRIVEIGSGYSSALMIDTNEAYFNNSVDITFIEPYPELLQSLVSKEDLKGATLLAKPLHEVDPKVFKSLKPNDILFIDSTHVSKAGSDVNQIFFDILPLVKPGVIIHIHDIFYPFEYPKEWIWETRAWNEDYIVRAFLHNNQEYEILLFNDFIGSHHSKLVHKDFPLTKKNGGGSLWLQKV